MADNWRERIAEAAALRHRLAELDQPPVFPYDAPALPADAAELARAEDRLGFALDGDYRAFLSCADGWANFDQTVSLFGAVDLGVSELYRHACEMIDVVADTGLLDALGVDRAALFPIAASFAQPELFAMARPESDRAGEVFLLPGDPDEQFSGFAAFFADVVESYVARIQRLEAASRPES